MKEVIVIGGGVIGLCSAYYLVKAGHKVTVIDQSTMDRGASFVNAGYLTPSHIVPLAAPGAVKQGIKWMFNPSSPFYIKPRLDKSLFEWTWAFNKSCTKENVNKSIPVIKDINLLSARLFSEIKQEEGFNFHLENNGLLVLCQSEKMLEEEIHIARIAAAEGLEVKEISKSNISNIEKGAKVEAIGAVHYACDWHTTPHEFMNELQSWLKAEGVQFFKNEQITTLETSHDRIRSIASRDRNFTADEFVLAAGSWSDILSRKLGIKIPLQAGKGYRINVAQSTGITMPTVLAEARVAVTPMNGFTRFGGTMELSGINHDINIKRVEAIARAAQSYYPELKITAEEKVSVACGLRPVSPDGRPYIGKSAKCDNLTIATGHAMMGWSMGPATGKLVSEVVSEKKTSMSLDAFHPDRKF